MPVKLTTTIKNIELLENSTNADMILGFYKYLKSNNTSESYQNQNIKASINFAKFLGPDKDFYQLSKKEEILAFLNTKIKNKIFQPWNGNNSGYTNDRSLFNRKDICLYSNGDLTNKPFSDPSAWVQIQGSNGFVVSKQYDWTSIRTGTNSGRLLGVYHIMHFQYGKIIKFVFQARMRSQ
jgi:hypothetical protein